jgi:hypothetical protein
MIVRQQSPLSIRKNLAWLQFRAISGTAYTTSKFPDSCVRNCAFPHGLRPPRDRWPPPPRQECAHSPSSDPSSITPYSAKSPQPTTVANPRFRSGVLAAMVLACPRVSLSREAGGMLRVLGELVANLNGLQNPISALHKIFSTTNLYAPLHLQITTPTCGYPFPWNRMLYLNQKNLRMYSGPQPRIDRQTLTVTST